MDDAVKLFLEKLEQGLVAGQFVKLTLSKPVAALGGLRNVYARMVELKGQPVLSFTLRYETRDEVKNHSFGEAVAFVGLWVGQEFLQADLFMLAEDVSLVYNKKRRATLLTRRATHSAPPPAQHDLPKQRLLSASGGGYLQAMGIAGSHGEVLKSGQKKFRQINKYTEIIDSILQRHPLPAAAHIVDMGSGKGYLTFALYDHLRNNLGLTPTVTGIELRPHLVEFCNELAQESQFGGLQFIAQDIHDYHPERIDMLIALHACDIATDIAIAKGIQAGADIIVVAPCCHRQIRPQIDNHTALRAILKHGIMTERQAEWLTDGIRALILEAAGYHTKVFEFISVEHTPKNLMITATKGTPNPQALAQVAEIKSVYGIEYHYLERLLGLG